MPEVLSWGGTTLPQTPIFIHAMWRTGSTYIWKKFYDQNQYVAYYEPLHEQLWIEQLTEQHLTPDYDPALRHPETKGSFWAAYYPLRRKVGIKFFQKGFPYERYCLDEDAKSPSLYRYIGNLVTTAARQGKVPVLQFNRSLLRSRWLSKNFNSRAILLLRKPIDIWRSFLSLGNYFVAGICLIIGQNRKHPILKHLADRYDVPFFRSNSFVEEARFYIPFAQDRVEELYPMFYEFYILTCIYNVAFSDCILDMNAITTDLRRRQMVCESLENLGIRISLDDCVIPHYQVNEKERKWLALEPAARARLQDIVPSKWRIPRRFTARHFPMLTDYFQTVFSEFVV